MDLTKEEILTKNVGKLAVSGLKWKTLGERKELIFKAMQEYAEQEAKAYANWLAHQVIAGRTAAKLWLDYQAEVVASD